MKRRRNSGTTVSPSRVDITLARTYNLTPDTTRSLMELIRNFTTRFYSYPLCQVRRIHTIVYTNQPWLWRQDFNSGLFIDPLLVPLFPEERLEDVQNFLSAMGGGVLHAAVVGTPLPWSFSWQPGPPGHVHIFISVRPINVTLCLGIEVLHYIQLLNRLAGNRMPAVHHSRAGV
jgi:hypothetical protein